MPICDLEFIKGITPGSYTFPISVIELYIKETPIKLSELKNVIKEKNWEETYSIAHKIKPGTLMLGLPSENTDALLAILKNTKNKKNLEEVYQLFKTFSSNFEEILKDLEKSMDLMKKGV